MSLHRELPADIKEPLCVDGVVLREGPPASRLTATDALLRRPPNAPFMFAHLIVDPVLRDRIWISPMPVFMHNAPFKSQKTRLAETAEGDRIQSRGDGE